MWPRRVNWTVGIPLTIIAILVDLYLTEKTGLYTFTPFSFNSQIDSRRNTKILIVIGVCTFWYCVATFIRYMHMNPPQVTRRHPIYLDERLFKSTVDIARDLREGAYTSVEITTLFIDHIKNIDANHINAVVFRRFELALQEAAEADKKLAAYRNNPKSVEAFDIEQGTGNWLLGVPTTIKECFSLEGASNCVGHPMRTDVRCETDAPTVARLRKAGAVIMGTTNTSELCMWLESSNHVYGTTCNAYDAGRIVGGSSGGECAALAAIFTPLGLTSDIGGSIRIPAFFNGVFGMKPSTRLVTNRGQYPGTKTLGHFLLCTGPSSRHPGDLYPLLKTLATGGFLECEKQFPPCPMVKDPREVKVDKTKTIYLIEDLCIPFTFLSDDQRRATRVATETVAARTGAKLIRVNLNDAKTCPDPMWQNLRRALEMWSAAMDQEAESYVEMLKRDYADGRYGVFKELFKWMVGASYHTFPSIMLGVVETLQTTFVPKKTNQAFVKMANDLTENIGQVLGNNGVIICPTLPWEAPKHSAPKLLSLGFCYTALWNALQLPVAAVPVWLSEQQKMPLGVSVVSKWGNDQMSLAFANALHEETPYCYYKTPRWIRRKTA